MQHAVSALHPDQEPFKTYQALLLKWQKAINLVAPSTLSDIWNRHILDSAQLFSFIDPQAVIGDMGSGAGFPGLVLAMMGARHIHLVEADTRKCLFLEEVIRQTRVCATVHPVRLENYQGPPCTTWVARAFAPLEKILSLAQPFLTSDTRLVLLKGDNAIEEIEKARERWHLRVEFYPSLTHAKGQIIVLTQVSRQ